MIDSCAFEAITSLSKEDSTSATKINWQAGYQSQQVALPAGIVVTDITGNHVLVEGATFSR